MSEHANFSIEFEEHPGAAGMEDGTWLRATLKSYYRTGPGQEPMEHYCYLKSFVPKRHMDVNPNEIRQAKTEMLMKMTDIAFRSFQHENENSP